MLSAVTESLCFTFDFRPPVNYRRRELVPNTQVSVEKDGRVVNAFIYVLCDSQNSESKPPSDMSVLSIYSVFEISSAPELIDKVIYHYISLALDINCGMKVERDTGSCLRVNAFNALRFQSKLVHILENVFHYFNHASKITTIADIAEYV